MKRISQSKDPVLTLLKRFITNGWPAYAPYKLKPFSKAKDEYTIQNGVVYRGLRVVPPRDMRQRILHTLHGGHPGIVKMIRVARQYFWWPGIDADINAFVQRCETCQVNARKRTNANLCSWEEPKEFLERVHVDVAHFKGHKMLLLIDAYAKWVDVHLLPSLSSHAAIAAVRQTFKYVGLPRTLVTDNGTNFCSEEFDQFLRQNFVRHIRTPPGHHQSNGLAERAIQELKFTLRKSSGEDVEAIQRTIASFCLSFNTSPACNGSVPSSMIFLKALRTRLSITCTERLAQGAKLPGFVRMESQPPRPGLLSDAVGRNVGFDHRGRLVHDSDFSRRPNMRFSEQEMSKAPGGPEQYTVLPSGEDAIPSKDDSEVREEQPSQKCSEAGVDVPRVRPQRIRRAPVRFGYDSF